MARSPGDGSVCQASFGRHSGSPRATCKQRPAKASIIANVPEIPFSEVILGCRESNRDSEIQYRRAMNFITAYLHRLIASPLPK